MSSGRAISAEDVIVEMCHFEDSYVEGNLGMPTIELIHRRTIGMTVNKVFSYVVFCAPSELCACVCVCARLSVGDVRQHVPSSW